MCYFFSCIVDTARSRIYHNRGDIFTNETITPAITDCGITLTHPRHFHERDSHAGLVREFGLHDERNLVFMEINPLALPTVRNLRYSSSWVRGPVDDEMLEPVADWLAAHGWATREFLDDLVIQIGATHLTESVAQLPAIIATAGDIASYGPVWILKNYMVGAFEHPGCYHIGHHCKTAEFIEALFNFLRHAHWDAHETTLATMVHADLLGNIRPYIQFKQAQRIIDSTLEGTCQATGLD